MLTKLRIEGFKSLRQTEIEFRPMTVLFGPNAAGKSNILDAIQTLSRLATERTLSDALSAPIRGYPLEAFSFSEDGLAGLLAQERASFRIESDVTTASDRYGYTVQVEIQPDTGTLSTGYEELSILAKRTGEQKGQPRLETVNDRILIRSRSRPGRPREELLGQNHTKVSDPRLGGTEYRQIEEFRHHLSGWRTYYLDPRIAMRRASPPAQVTDIGVLGENIAPFLYRLRAEKPKYFDTIRRSLTMIIPSVEDLNVDLDSRRGTLDVFVRQSGIEYSSRIISEGTLRVLALCAISFNPWTGALVAFEEPENGVHPRRLELVAELLTSLIEQNRQVIVTTHSPVFCRIALELARAHGKENISVLKVSSDGSGTSIKPLHPDGPLFMDPELSEALRSVGEDGHFESLMVRGLLDA